MGNMATYNVIPGGDGLSFDINVVGGNGARNTMLGFGSKEEVLAWIARDKRLNDPTDPFMSVNIVRRAGGQRPV
jgi:hypothetical protein